MKNFKTLLFLIFALLFIVHQSDAQLVTSNAMTPQQLVQNVLVGNGVATSNITFTGDPNAIGSFDGTACNVGLDSGIILTSGTVLNTMQFGVQEGPFGPNDQSGAGVDNNQPGDPLLAAATGNLSFNAARLEFDFIPQSDSLKFNFVFGSEEYLEFVNAGVNDAFGFFISGPNPLGGNYTDENIAIVPGTNLPVTIDNLNSTQNAAYHIDNGDGFSAPQNASPTYVQYDGLTTVLEAKASVVCGQSYHIIIVISDIGDGILDSGVFLEAGSFSSPGIDLSSELSFQTTIGNDSTLVEGCGGADLWFVRNDSLAFTQTIDVTYSGTATNGVDVNNLPPTVTFLPGQDSVSITIDAVFDNIPEGTEYIIISTSLPSACNGTVGDSILLYIENVDELTLNVPDTIVPCPNTPATLISQVAGGTPGYTYLWSTGETTAQINVSPITTTTYYLTIMDTCGQTALDSAVVTVPAFGPIGITVSNDTTVNCINQLISLNAQTSGGGANHVVTWNTGDTGNNIDVNVVATTTYTATVTDACGNTASADVTVTVIPVPITSVITADTSVCPGDSVTLVVTPSGGTGNDYTFEWNTGQTDSMITVSPSSTFEYIVGIGDECGTISIWDSTTVNIIEISANFAATGLMEEESEVTFNNLSTGADSYLWDFGNGETSTLVNPSTFYGEPANYSITLIATNAAGCIDSITQIVDIKPEFLIYVPNAFTPDGDEFNQTWDVYITGHDAFDFDLFLYNRWGEIIWESHDASIGWDGTYQGQLVQSEMYTWQITVKLPYVDERREFVGHLNVLR